MNLSEDIFANPLQQNGDFINDQVRNDVVVDFTKMQSVLKSKQPAFPRLTLNTFHDR